MLKNYSKSLFNSKCISLYEGSSIFYKIYYLVVSNSFKYYPPININSLVDEIEINSYGILLSFYYVS